MMTHRKGREFLNQSRLLVRRERGKFLIEFLGGGLLASLLPLPLPHPLKASLCRVAMVCFYSNHSGYQCLKSNKLEFKEGTDNVPKCTV